ncbi:MAG: Holliday junction branch migration protein RuvA [Anaerolineaceae bacterium]
MIASLSGEVLEKQAGSLVIGVGGVGLLVGVPASVADHARVGEHLFLYTHLLVREDALNLYGFENPETRQLFLLLLSVNGVGARMALAILSMMTVDSIRRAVINEQPELFARVPGVGKKTAQKILLQLQGKVGGESTLEAVSRLTDVDTEVLGALTTLGYSIVEAQSALQAIPKDAPEDAEERLRLALQYFSS